MKLDMVTLEKLVDSVLVYICHILSNLKFTTVIAGWIRVSAGGRWLGARSTGGSSDSV